MKHVYFLFFFLMQALGLRAQDPQFSQYYAAPLYLNPAFTGTSEDHRFIANYRNQWPNAARGFVTYAFSYDVNLTHYNSGVGLLATVDQAGTAGMRSSQLNFLYSYKWSIASKWVVSAGLNFGYASRSIDLNRLVFGDQLQFDSNGNVPTDDPAIFNLGNVHYFDFNSGVLAYNKNFWFGFSASHLNTPNRSLLDQEAQVPMKTSLHGGVRIPLYGGPFKKDHISVLAPSFVYKKQGRFDQLDVGVHFLYDPIMLGVWYRGIPLQQNVRDNISQDAVVVILGLQFDQIEIGYSYDFTVSELGPISGGAHEIAMRYKVPLAAHIKTKRKDKFIPCPTFIKK
ncbi:MAG: type IX secretion system membrane protein PorP/SprF [Cyclobacteriaceae bacterium]|nr:type IX secretion system membrane protein PorP/SprF [Cytophagales bacterium]MBX2901552.1 type IX secretion system membrane protein PorP/SprF [Cyclobacteriaceae bacterium]